MTGFKSLAAAACLATTVGGPFAPAPAQAQNAICLGQLMVFGGNFCPRGWANADGQLLSISQYSALFSIYGTIYGGDGRTTFGLPDLRGRSIVHVGSGPGLPPVKQGQKAGTATVNQVVSHTHAATSQVRASTATATVDDPDGAYLASGPNNYTTSADVNMGSAASPSATTTVSATGIPTIDKRSPMQVIRYCVAIEGVYCSRN